ncbi:AraC family transcriptional regulator [Variovorax sp. dw_954]|uniref:AraC family transcriptional regulator n=1 Tax=Variovorax sp. dw_954 TaxID=2720078 RepID=UPI001BD5B254|nr:AraC family transcriptional regulator [Variovorax sp. dw_954]
MPVGVGHCVQQRADDQHIGGARAAYLEVFAFLDAHVSSFLSGVGQGSQQAAGGLMVAGAGNPGLDAARRIFDISRHMSNSVRAASLRGFSELVRSLGGDPAAMLRSQKLPEKLLGDDELLVPAFKLARLLEATARELECPDFGLRLAQAQDMGILGPIAVAIQNSPTLGEALKIASRYMYVHNQGLAITLVTDGSAGANFAELRYETSGMHLPESRQAFELMLCGGHRILALLGGDRYRLEAVHLPHAPVASASAYRHAFGIAPRFNQPSASLIVPRKLFDAALPQANATLRNLATHYLESTFDAPQKSTRTRVQLAIARTLGTSQCALEGVAAMLALHPRTLQRQLSAEDVRFADVRDAVMREAALRYLAGPLPLVQVCEQLGLSEQSALTRSCKRWFGETPLAIRRREQMVAGASKAPGA